MVQYCTLKDSFLSEHINGVYYSTSEQSSAQSIILFPNVGASISFYFDAVFKEDGNQNFSSHYSPGNFGVVLQINRIDPVRIVEHGKQQRITVIFRPLGVNHFLPAALQEIARGKNPSNIDLTFLDEYKAFVRVLYFRKGLAEKLQAIEIFFMSLYREFEAADVAKVFTRFDESLSLQETAVKNHMSIKTFERLFIKHLCLTPVQYKNILRFRKSIAGRLTGRKQSLNDVAVEYNFTDLPYMIRVYKKYTGLTAKDFFDNITINPGGYIFQSFK